MLGELQYQLLRRLAPSEPTTMDGSAYQGKSKVRILLGDEFLREVTGKRVIDFGCGLGDEAIELARYASHVEGIDIHEGALANARRRAAAIGLGNRCTFATTPSAAADYVISIDSFEHFDDPPVILEVMHEMLRPKGVVIASFGPTWFHPYGGHMQSVFPWAHLMFSETALMRWRSAFRTDGATHFREVEGGLNGMTIARFERIVRESPFTLDRLETVPIARLQRVHARWNREFTTSIVRCRLTRA